MNRDWILNAILAAAVICGCQCDSRTVETEAASPGPETVTPIRPEPPAPSPWDLPEGVQARDWKYIVLHHSATEMGSAAAFDRYHRRVRGWSGLAYHFVIGNGQGAPDGAVEIGFRWPEQAAGAHAGVREYNERGIGICLVGDFDKSAPTEAQMRSLRELVSCLQERFGIPDSGIVFHRDIGNTECPGRHFPRLR